MLDLPILMIAAVKGFLTKGMEQLLWHITSIEALIGEKADLGLTKMLKTRAARALAESESERKQIRKSFEELYGFRSDLVHGNADLLKREVYQGHLGRAREIARRLTLWMLHYLAHIHDGLGERALPSRETLLSLLDMDQRDRVAMATSLSALPTEFPNPPGWSS